MKSEYQLQGREKVNEYPHKVTGTPVLSVCIQTYNHGKFISQCLDGVLAQKTTFPIEIIIGEDGSKDTTREICIEYAKQHPDKIRLYLHDRSNVIYVQGKATGRYNFIHNVRQAKGKYIALIDGDDFWTDPFKLQKQVDFLEANKSYIGCFGNANFISDNSIMNEKKIKQYPSRTFTLADLVQNNEILTLTSVFRNNPHMFPEDSVKVRIGDWPLFSVLSSFGDFYYFDEVWAAYRLHPGGVFSAGSEYNKTIDLINAQLFIYDNFKEKYKKLIRESLLKKFNYIAYELSTERKKYWSLRFKLFRVLGLMDITKLTAHTLGIKKYYFLCIAVTNKIKLLITQK